jgi:hypothetical protein
MDITKMLGWGLTDVTTNGSTITDPRLNMTSRYFTDPYSDTPSEYAQYLRGVGGDSNREAASIESLIRHDAVPRKTKTMMRPSEAVVHRNEYGLPNVLCIRPVTFTDWNRRGDIIDWTEETYLRPWEERQGNRVERFEHPIYPFDGSYMDTATGARLPMGTVMSWWRAYNATRDPRSTASRAGESDELAQDLGYRDTAHAAASVAPVVPQEVRDVTRFLELFTDDTVWRQLRPMRYLYWS